MRECRQFNLSHDEVCKIVAQYLTKKFKEPVTPIGFTDADGDDYVFKTESKDPLKEKQSEGASE